jgi:hypothetical protein
MLTAPIVEILRDLHHALVQDFWSCWLALSAVMVIGATWFVSRSNAPRSERRADTKIVLARRPVGTPANIVAVGVLVTFLVAYIAMTLVWEDFTYIDNSVFTLGTLRGMTLCRRSGRAQDASFRSAGRNST